MFVGASSGEESPVSPASTSRRLGAYGLCLTGLDAAAPLLVESDPAWPKLEIVLHRSRSNEVANRVGLDEATMALLGASVHVERSPGRATFAFEHDISIDAVVHPYLAPVAGLVNHWNGRESIHAGGFVLDGGAWGLVGERGGGKSSTLARLALDGVPVVADDVLVTDGVRVFAGPRALDLRREPAELLGAGEPLGVLGARERWRLHLGDVAATSALAGWVFLAWGPDVSLTPVPAGERLQRLAAERAVRLAPRNAEALLTLAAHPAWELRRPRSWSSLDAAAKLLLETLPRASTHAGGA